MKSWLFLNPGLTKLIFSLAYILIWAKSFASAAHVIRDSFTTLRQITKHTGELLDHIRMTRFVNHFLVDATEEQLNLADICVVCRSKLRCRRSVQLSHAQIRTFYTRSNFAWGISKGYSQPYRPKYLPCGHVLHKRCLQLWFEVQATCPSCRRRVQYWCCYTVRYRCMHDLLLLFIRVVIYYNYTLLVEIDVYYTKNTWRYNNKRSVSKAPWHLIVWGWQGRQGNTRVSTVSSVTGMWIHESGGSMW